MGTNETFFNSFGSSCTINTTAHTCVRIYISLSFLRYLFCFEFNNSYSNRCKVIIALWFWFVFWLTMLGTFFPYLWIICISSLDKKMAIHVFCQIFYFYLVCVCSIMLYEIFYIFWRLTSCHIYSLKIFLMSLLGLSTTMRIYFVVKFFCAYETIMFFYISVCE